MKIPLSNDDERLRRIRVLISTDIKFTMILTTAACYYRKATTKNERKNQKLKLIGRDRVKSSRNSNQKILSDDAVNECLWRPRVKESLWRQWKRKKQHKNWMKFDLDEEPVWRAHEIQIRNFWVLMFQKCGGRPWKIRKGQLGGAL